MEPKTFHNETNDADEVLAQGFINIKDKDDKLLKMDDDNYIKL